VEVKTRVFASQIAEEERIAAQWNNNIIICIVGEHDLTAVMVKDPVRQIMIQMASLQLHWAVHLVGQPGTTNRQGRLIYTVFVYVPAAVMDDFKSMLIDRFDATLSHFYTCQSITEELMERLPTSFMVKDVNLMQSRWAFFSTARRYVIPNLYFGFPPCSIIKTCVQVLYNSLKGGLNSNLQQF